MFKKCLYLFILKLKMLDNSEHNDRFMQNDEIKFWIWYNGNVIEMLS